jgi:hypothetical protein
MSMQIVKRIFGNRKLPENMSDAEYEIFMQTNFKKWITEFEDGGFLDATKLPPIRNEDELIDKLMQHENELLVLKYWKHGCIPCLSVAEMYKEAQQLCMKHGKKVVWYSVDSKLAESRQMVDFQLISGTPTIQMFHKMKQVGEEVRATRIQDLMKELDLWAPE